MSPSQFQLEVANLSDVPTRVAEKYGPSARIVSVEAVTTGGIQGFFAQRHYDVTVEVPDEVPSDAHVFDPPARAGIAALLEDAEAVESSGHFQASASKLSTTSVHFAAIMADLTLNTTASPEVRLPKGPTPLTAPGDLVLIIGLGEDPLRIARSMARAGMSTVRTAGSLTVAGIEHVSDRRSCLAARAAGVENGRSVLIAYGLGGVGADPSRADAIRRLSADQVWVVVDASRKHADTARWVEELALATDIDGLAVCGREFTETPDSVADLGLPVGWIESVSVG